MLTYLELKNYIFIKELKLEFDEKFNIFTGETGAGKSIIVEAIALLCGEKQRSCVVGEFADKCEITGIFEIQNHKIKETLEELLKDTELELNHQLILRREIDKQNRSKFYLNDKLVSLTLVKTFFDIVVDIHGQNEHQKLLSSTHQLATIDRYAEIDEEIKKFKSDYNIYKKKLLLIENLKTELQYNKQQYELLNYQITEIEQAHLTPEDELLEEELEKAKNVEKILNLLSDLKFNLVEIKEKIANVVRIFQILKNYIPSIDDKTTQVISSEVDNLNLQIEEYKKTFSNYTT
ncbi:MAG: hypothetical protein NZ839_04815, partial [Endomicrobia bacterium]|nr:hypothetical protein [Endomicrobiia bacterium]